MSSSSSSSSSKSNKKPQNVVKEHDVFLSFRGEDTRSGFTSYLHRALVNEGIKTFMDNEKLRKGSVISAELMNAIEGSRSSVVILSENYAYSIWCLTELCKIVECMDTSGLIVLPIFYHVPPSDVRNLRGSYGEAFKKHQKNPRLDHEEMEAWGNALKKVGHISGWTVEETDVEVKFIEDFIAHISSQLDIRRESPHEPAVRSSLQDVVCFDHDLMSKTAFTKRPGASKKGKGKNEELSPHEAASIIQLRFRQYLIRKSQALRALRDLAVAKSKLKELRALFNNFSYRRRVAHDAEERQRFTEKIIVLILTVDAIEGADLMVRLAKRSMVDELEAMLVVVDPQPADGKSLP